MTRNGNESPWNENRIAQLLELWPTGASLSEIARALGGGITRNAVAGKADRLNLSARADYKNTAAPFRPNMARRPAGDRP